MIQRDFTDEQNMFRDAYRKFLAAEIVPHMEDWREAGIVDRSAFRKAGEQGFLMVWPDEEYGGTGDADFRFEQVIIEETAYARAGDWYNSLHSRLVGPYITRFGSAEQCSRFLPKCVSGEHILAIAMTEPDAGSDVRGMKCSAIKDCDDWVLNGSKHFISGADHADLLVRHPVAFVTICIKIRLVEPIHQIPQFIVVELRIRREFLLSVDQHDQSAERGVGNVSIGAEGGESGLVRSLFLLVVFRIQCRH